MLHSQSIKTALLQALYPEGVVCFACGREAPLNQQALCADCAASLTYCSGLPLPRFLTSISCALLYEGAAVSMIRRLKYNQGGWVAKPLSALMRVPESWSIDCVVPVPLYPLKERTRGYNQSALLAAHIARQTGLPLEPALLRRTRDTGSQTRLDRPERAKNMQGAFAALPCREQRILLIDDVCTTGSTLSAAAEALREAGAQQVYALCACYRS